MNTLAGSKQLGVAQGLHQAPTEPADKRSTGFGPVLRDEAGRLLPGSARPPRRRRGGQAGNLNSTRHPWVTFWRRRALKPEDRWALALVRDYVSSLIADKGGEANVSFAETKVAELAAVARVCWALAMVAGDLEAVARFVGQERASLADLGLERRAKDVPSLSAYLASRHAVDVTPQPHREASPAVEPITESSTQDGPGERARRSNLQPEMQRNVQPPLAGPRASEVEADVT